MVLRPINEIAFYIYSFPIYWYGIIMALAIYIGMTLSNKLYNKYYPFDRKDIIYEYAPMIIIFGIIFARLYYCLLSFPYYYSNPLEVINLRQGGLSIHGAILGGILALYLISRKITTTKLYKLLAVSSIGTLLAQSIGRWGNYFNCEAYGFPTNQTWGLYIPPAKRISEFAQYDYFHPTFLYESFFDFIGFIILLVFFIYSRNKNDGLTFFLYLMIYSTIRFFIEFIRVDSVLKVGFIPIPSIVCILAFLIGFYFYRRNSKRNY